MGRIYKNLFILPALLIALIPTETKSQRLVANVKVNTEKLINQETIEKLASLKNELEQYINDYDWTDNSRHFNISVQIDIFIERIQPTSFEDRYDAQFIISNGSDFQQSDKRWTFVYERGMPLPHKEQFHTLTGMVDYYIYLLLGQELDKISKLGGADYYDKAVNVVQLSKFNELFAAGWKERQIRVEKIIAQRNIPLRELEYFFTQTKQNLRLDTRKAAKQYLLVILIRLRELDPEMEGLSRFYQLHHLDLARYMSLLEMQAELQELTTLDPANAEAYRQFISQKSSE